MSDALSGGRIDALASASARGGGGEGWDGLLSSEYWEWDVEM